MNKPDGGKISFLELAKRVLDQAGQPLQASEIWQIASQAGLVALLNSTGKTPEQSFSARLYTDVQKPGSLFTKVGSGPARFELKTHAGPISVVQQSSPIPSPVKQKAYAERDLHPLFVYFADETFGIHCKTIYHERCLKQSARQNQWIHPDIVGFSLPGQDWTSEVVKLAQSTGGLTARLYSFELKISLDFATLREYFFQAVSNSSWAHEGYLVAVDIDDDADFRSELTRLSQSFDIGVIQLDINEPLNCTVLLPARKKTEIDWKTVDRISSVNPDFEEFIGVVANSLRINQPAVMNKFDKILDDSELATHLKTKLN